MIQLTLERATPARLDCIRRRPRPERVSIEERFQAYHNANPGVYDLLVRLARDVKARGKSNYGMKAIFERARWHHHIERGDSDFTLNNDFTAHYARLIEHNESDLRGFFAKRRLRSE
jgi:hypothetical protein